MTSTLHRLVLDAVSAMHGCPPALRVRAVETLGCELAVDLPPDGSFDDALVRTLDRDDVACALLIVLSRVVPGDRGRRFAALAFTVRCDIMRAPWLDHIGTAVATGRAVRVAQDRTARLGRHELYALEVNNGLERYSLCTGADLDRGTLLRSAVTGPVEEHLAGPCLSPDRSRPSGTVVATAEAVARMCAHLGLPPAPGARRYGPWVRWQLELITRDLAPGRAPGPSSPPDRRRPPAVGAVARDSRLRLVRPDDDPDGVDHPAGLDLGVDRVDRIPAVAERAAAAMLGTDFGPSARRLADRLVLRAPELLRRTRLRLWVAAVVYLLAEEIDLFTVECCVSRTSLARELGSTPATLVRKAGAIRTALAPLSLDLPPPVA